MARHNGYASQKGYELYDTTGGTEDWTYYATGGLGFTFEIGRLGFHPQYASVIAEYEGTSAEAGNRGGNREAYFEALENTADSSKRSTLTGKAPAGAVLRLKKSFTTFTSPVIDADGNEGPRQSFGDTLDSTMLVPFDGDIAWGINPSTRPVVAPTGRAATGPPSGAQNISDQAPPGPGLPCGATSQGGIVADPCKEDTVFTVPAAPADNATFKVRIDWGSTDSDYDLYIYRDDNADNRPDGAAVAQSAAGSTDFEQTSFGEPDDPIRASVSSPGSSTSPGPRPTAARSPTRDRSRPPRGPRRATRSPARASTARLAFGPPCRSIAGSARAWTSPRPAPA